MRWLSILFVVACADEGARPSLDGPVACGPNTCGSGQVCVVETTGSQCGVNPDAGIGPYQEISWACVELPAACDGVAACDCITGPGQCFGASEDFRRLSFGCI